MLIESIAQEARYATRRLRKKPAFSLIAILTLALGISATTSIFAVIDGILIRPLPYPAPDALVSVSHSAVFQGNPLEHMSLSPPMYVAYRDANQTFQQFGVWNSGTSNVTGSGDPEQIPTLRTTFEVLPALGIQPILGRWFSQADDSPGARDTAILTYAYWQRKFGGDKAIIGRFLTVDSRPRQI